MISFRFHLVSIVAVFLALAVGIVVGSTVIDRAIVDGLRSRVDEVSANLDERQAENDALSDRLDQLERFVVDAGPYSVSERLDGTFTVVVADRGVDQGPIDRMIDLLGVAGTTVRGQLRLDGSWTTDDADTWDALGELVPPVVDGDAVDDRSVAEVRTAAASALVEELASSTPGIQEGEDGDSVLEDLGALDLVDYEAIAEDEAPGPRRVLFVVVTGPASDLGGSDHVIAFAETAAEATGGVVVAEVWVESEDGPERAASLAPILDSAALFTQVATVDDLDLPQGPTTAVLTLAAAAGGTIGHYGVGEGAEASAPPPPPADS